MFKYEGYEIHVTQHGKFCVVVDEERITTSSLVEAQKEIRKRAENKRTKIVVPAWFFVDGEVEAGHYHGIHKGWMAHSFSIGKGKLQSGGYGGVKMFLSKTDAVLYRDLKKQIDNKEKEMETLLIQTRPFHVTDYNGIVAREDAVIKRLTDGNSKTNP